MTATATAELVAAPAIPPASKSRRDVLTKLGRPPKTTKKQFTPDERRDVVRRFVNRPKDQLILDFCKQEDIVDTVIRRWAADPRYAYNPKSPPKALAPVSADKVLKVIAKVPRFIENSRNYTTEFKDAVMEVYKRRDELGLSVPQVAKKCGLQPPVVYSWAQQRGISPARATKALTPREPHAMIAAHKLDSPTKVRRVKAAAADDEREKTVARLKLSILQGIIGLARLQGSFDIEELLGGGMP